MNRAINHKSLFDFVHIFAVIVLTVCGQLILKWQVAKAGVFPRSFRERALFLLRLVFNPSIIGGLFAGFLAFLCWMPALTKFELSYAYPHDSVIHDHVFLASHIVVSGHVDVGEYCFIGVNATLRNSIKIVPRTLIGAGAVIMKDTEEREVYVPQRVTFWDKKSDEIEL